MGISSQTSESGSRKPVTYSRCAVTTSNGRSGSAASNDDETKGEQAFERIRRLIRGDDQLTIGAQRATNVHNGGAQTKSPARVGSLKKPSVSFANTAQKVDAVRHEGTRSIASKIKTDMEEAVARSLADSALPSTPLPAPKTEEEYESDVAQAKLLSLLDDGPSKPSSNTRSYKNLGSGSTSSATAPHAPLHGLLENMNSSVKALERINGKGKTANVSKLAECVQDWGSTVVKVIYALEAAEVRRIKDLQGQLDFDREIEDKHQKRLDTSNKMWEVKMQQKEREWQKKMEEQNQAYEAQVAGHKAAKVSPPNQEHMSRSADAQTFNDEHVQPRTARSPSPHTQSEVDRLAQEIATLKADHEATLHNTEASYTGAVAFLKQKADRLADQNAELRRTQKVKEGKENEGKENIKNEYEDQIRQSGNESEKLADVNAKLRQGKQKTGGGSSAPSVVAGSESLTPSSSSKRKVEDVTDDNLTGLTTHSVPLPRSGTEASPLKRKLSHVAIPRSESVGRSPKRARTRSID
jgi:hypothetical protein